MYCQYSVHSGPGLSAHRGCVSTEVVCIMHTTSCAQPLQPGAPVHNPCCTGAQPCCTAGAQYGVHSRSGARCTTAVVYCEHRVNDSTAAHFVQLYYHSHYVTQDMQCSCSAGAQVLVSSTTKDEWIAYVTDPYPTSIA